MIKLLKLIYVNILSLTNIERIRIAKKSNIRDSSEIRLIIYSIVGLALGYLIYAFVSNYLIDYKLYLLVIGYIISYFFLLVSDLFNTKDSLFSSSSNDDYLFSLPLKNTDIILSRLGIIYIKNLFVVLIIMLPIYLVTNNIVSIISTTSLVYLLGCLFIPIIPIIISTLYSFVKVYYDKSKKFKILRILILLVIGIILFLVLNNVKTNDINSLINRVSIFNPIIYFFKKAIIDNSSLFIILFLLVPIYLFYLFTKIISFNYNYMVSKLRGIKLKKNKIIKVSKRKGIIRSLISKELINLNNNKLYLSSSINYGIILTIVYIICSFIIDRNAIVSNRHAGIYIMIILSFIASINCSTINSLSLERESIILYKSLPIKFYKVLISKWLVNIIIVLPIIIINAIVSILLYKLKKYSIIFFIINPLFEVIFISLLGLVLDYRFINYKDTNDSAIIKGRLLCYVPFIVTILMAILLFLLAVNDIYYLIMVSYLAFNIFFIIVLLLYLLFNYKKIYKNNL